MVYRLYLVFCLLVTFFSFTAQASDRILSEKDVKIYQAAIKESRKMHFEESRKLAATVKNNILVPYLEWLRLLKSSNDFKELSEFVYLNPLFPRLYQIKENAESAIRDTTSEELVRQWFNDYPASSTKGKMIYAELLQKDGKDDDAFKLIKSAWEDINFDDKLEKEFLNQYHSYLSQENHKNKVSNLLWERQTSRAKHLLNKLTPNNKLLAEARIALINKARKVDAAVSKVPQSLADDPGLIFDRAYWRRKKDRLKDAYEMHIHQSANLENPEKWWFERNILIREFIKKKDYNKAYNLASNHILEAGESFALAEWLSGFISLKFLHNNEQAFFHFAKMYDAVKSPVSLARAAFWCGKAQNLLGHSDDAKKWYEKAAQYQTTFYGQLAAKTINSKLINQDIKKSRISKNIVSSLKSHYVIKIIKALAEIGEDYDASLFSIAYFNSLEQEDAIRAFLKVLDEYVGRPDIAVAIGRRARYIKNLEIIDYAYPKTNFDFVEKSNIPLILAISRQESNFNPEAKSPAGARGLMQLIPATAKRIAKELKLKFHLSHLTTNTDYNVRLGNHYINKRIKQFDNYALAIAAYNAGASNVKKWLKDYQDPRTDNVDIIDWIELIPFSETRNYVQRVLENYEIYRRMLKQPTVFSENFNAITDNKKD